MFKKKTKVPATRLTAGWSDELIASLIGHRSEHGLGFPSNDYMALIDAYIQDSNNFETERRAYSHLEFYIDGHVQAAKVPVVIQFFPGSEDLAHFRARLTDPEVATIAGSGRVYGRAVLDGRYTEIGNEKSLTPVFEWNLFLTAEEWATIREALGTSGLSNSLVIGVRIGLPDSVTAQSIVNDSENTRLLIHRVWITSTTIRTTRGVGENVAFQIDTGRAWVS